MVSVKIFFFLCLRRYVFSIHRYQSLCLWKLQLQCNISWKENCGGRFVPWYYLHSVPLLVICVHPLLNSTYYFSSLHHQAALCFPSLPGMLFFSGCPLSQQSGMTQGDLTQRACDSLCDSDITYSIWIWNDIIFHHTLVYVGAQYNISEGST